MYITARGTDNTRVLSTQNNREVVHPAHNCYLILQLLAQLTYKISIFNRFPTTLGENY